MSVACIDCNRPYATFGLDLVLPRAQWLLIHPEVDGGILCANCIMARASRVHGCTVVHAVLEIVPPSLRDTASAREARIDG